MPGHEPFKAATGYWLVTSTIVIGAVLFAYEFVPQCLEHPHSSSRVDLATAFTAWDGNWYKRVATEGYSYDPKTYSSVNFFPLYPMLAAIVNAVTGLRIEYALLFVSNVSFLAALVVLAMYVRARISSEGAPDLPDYILLALCLCPVSFYFRMAYSESLFLLVTISVLHGLHVQWPPFWIAVLAGLATATRSMGVIVAAVAVVSLWSDRPRSPGDLLARLGQSLLSFWGIAAYMAYLGFAFGDPLVWIKSHELWNERGQDLATKVLGLLTLEPLWAVYNPDSLCYWARVPPRDNIFLSMKAANPIYFLVAIALVCDGARRNWLNRNELLLAAGCFAFLYWFGASHGCMSSMARYSATVFPVYLVLGRYLAALPSPIAALCLTAGGAIMAVYTVMFVSWYWFF